MSQDNSKLDLIENEENLTETAISELSNGKGEDEDEDE